MTPEQYLVNLLNTDGQEFDIEPRNIKFLKKIILAMYHGNLRINGQPPNKKYSLGNYLLDDHRVMFDFSHLSDKHKAYFKEWLLREHRRDLESVIQDDFKISEYRGFPAEVKLTWWGRFLNSWIFKKLFYKLSFAPFLITPNYQLNSIELAAGKKNGILFGFNQFGASPIKGKYGNEKDQLDSRLNSKRILLTNEIVEQLCNTPVEDFECDSFKQYIQKPHPLSTKVTDEEAYFKRMREHRIDNSYFKPRSLFVRFFRWLRGRIFTQTEPESQQPSPQYFDFCSHDDLTIKINDVDSQVLVHEKRPMPDTFVFCGGGAKIFGHLGCIKEFKKAGICGKKFAGSSAGAIMAMLCYLGYEPDEIEAYFKSFNAEILVKYDISRRGLSKPNGLHAAIHRMVVQRFDLIKIALNETHKGSEFLAKEYYNNNNKITFGLLRKVYQQFPKIAKQYNLGEQLVVTATNAQDRLTSPNANKTVYFGNNSDKDHVEIADAVMASACFPILYTPVIIDGVPYRDGGLLNNLPMELFKDDKSTFLESIFGVDFKVIGLQFDNGGVERNVLDRLQKRIYRESWVYNKLLSLLTGVDDSVDGWVKDRIKLLKNPSVIIIPVGGINATNFDIDDEVKNQLLEMGQSAAKDYLQARFEINESEEGVTCKNQELIYHRFNNMEELLGYCYYRNRRDIFETLAQKIEKEHLFDYDERLCLLNKVKSIRHLFELRHLALKNGDKFRVVRPVEKKKTKKTFTLFFDEPQQSKRNNSLYGHVHSVFCLALSDKYFSSKSLASKFRSIRHGINIREPLKPLIDLHNLLLKENNNCHIVLYLIQIIIGKYIHSYKTQDDLHLLEQSLSHFVEILKGKDVDSLSKNSALNDNWHCSEEQCYARLNQHQFGFNHACASQHDLIMDIG